MTLPPTRLRGRPPFARTYRDVEVLEHPPNGQGLAALLALNIVEGYALAEMDFL